MKVKDIGFWLLVVGTLMVVAVQGYRIASGGRAALETLNPATASGLATLGGLMAGLGTLFVFYREV